jgi:hypothetical protein
MSGHGIDLAPGRVSMTLARFEHERRGRRPQHHRRILAEENDQAVLGKSQRPRRRIDCCPGGMNSGIWPMELPPGRARSE